MCIRDRPYDVVVERLHIEEPEPPAPVTEPELSLIHIFLLSEQRLQICNLEKQQMVGRQEKTADQGCGVCTA